MAYAVVKGICCNRQLVQGATRALPRVSDA